MNRKIITFINDRYLSMNLLDLIFKILSYFAYSYLMVIPTTFEIFEVQKYGFENVSFLDSRVIPLLILAGVLSLIMSAISAFIYHFKTKWSVILIRGLTFFYVSITLLLLSCFSNFQFNIINILSIVIKLIVYVACYVIYINYLFKKKLPNIENIVHGKSSTSATIFIAPLLVILLRPLISVISIGNFQLNFNWLVSAGEYLIAVGIIINIVDAAVKTYYAKKYSVT